MTVQLSRKRPEVAPESLRALLGGIVDYAGLFPPAKLDMDATVANYARELAGDDSWMLGRLIVPAGRLDEFEAAAAEHLARVSEPWQISALVAVAGQADLETDLERVTAFNETHADASNGPATIGVIELRAGDADAIDAALDRLPDDLFPFFEIPVHDDPRGMIAAMTGSDAGTKVRTGGGDGPPQVEHLARFIAGCAAAEIPFKATAGLHHPFRNTSKSTGKEEFGFLSLFVAAALAFKKKLTADELSAVLLDASPDSFEFAETSLRYRDTELRIDQIEDARLKFAISFGSCSFTEPVEDLRAMGLL